MKQGRSAWRLQTREADAGSPLPRMCNAREAAVGQVKHAPASVGTAIIDGHYHAFPIVTILHMDARTEWEIGMGGSHGVGIETLATGSALSVIAVTNAVVRSFATLIRRRLGLRSQGAKQQKERKETMHQKGVVAPEALARLRAKVFSLCPMGSNDCGFLHICYRNTGCCLVGVSGATIPEWSVLEAEMLPSSQGEPRG